MKRKRHLTHDERHLWQRLTRSVRPLRPLSGGPPSGGPPAAGARLPGDDGQADGSSGTPPGSHKRAASGAASRGALSGGAAQTPRKARPPPVMESGDPRQVRHVARGRRHIDATLDLHGMTQDQAYIALSRFLVQARAIGHATLLVITGKGAPDADRAPGYSVSRGILRRRFLDWADGPFREHIGSIAQAHQRHGGAGAFYVFLKKRR